MNANSLLDLFTSSPPASMWATIGLFGAKIVLPFVAIGLSARIAIWLLRVVRAGGEFRG